METQDRNAAGRGRGVGGLTKQCSSGVPNSEPQLAAGPLSHKTGQASISQVCQTVWRQGRMGQWGQWGLRTAREENTNKAAAPDGNWWR